MAGITEHLGIAISDADAERISKKQLIDIFQEAIDNGDILLKENEFYVVAFVVPLIDKGVLRSSPHVDSFEQRMNQHAHDFVAQQRAQSPHESIRNALIASYKPRTAPGVACSICGTSKIPMAFHIIEYAQDQTFPQPSGFVPMSASFGTIRGSFPICQKCAPTCSKCGLPILTRKVKQHHASLVSQLQSPNSPLNWGLGRCRHIRLFGKWIVV